MHSALANERMCPKVKVRLPEGAKERCKEGGFVGIL